jgi:hypothetical protein
MMLDPLDEPNPDTDPAAAHRRCERCADHPAGHPHCWMLVIREGTHEPLMACRHCPATADVCPGCDGEGIAVDAHGKAVDCPLCEGWGATGVMATGAGDPAGGT